MKGCAVFLALAVGACATVPPPLAGPTARLGQVPKAGGTTIRPIQVIEDSRCPINARCIWAGRLILLVKVNYRGGSEEYRGNLTLGEPLLLGPETVTLVAAEPAPVAGRTIEPRTYRFTFAYGRSN